VRIPILKISVSVGIEGRFEASLRLCATESKAGSKFVAYRSISIFYFASASSLLRTAFESVGRTREADGVRGSHGARGRGRGQWLIFWFALLPFFPMTNMKCPLNIAIFRMRGMQEACSKGWTEPIFCSLNSYGFSLAIVKELYYSWFKI
jgi:hypothetical protein